MRMTVTAGKTWMGQLLCRDSLNPAIEKFMRELMSRCGIGTEKDQTDFGWRNVWAESSGKKS